MTLTLLLDLDDTLLRNPLDQFIPAYINALSKHLAPFVSPEKMIPQLMHATDQMVAKNEPCETLETAFDNDFYPPLGIEKEQLSQVIRNFYTSQYDRLRSVTSPDPFAQTLLNHAFSQGWKVVIATNPIFPEVAVWKRLEWAGIPHSSFAYSMVTSYEIMHFAKPNPAYFAEILGLLGWEEVPAVMVGDNLKDDIIPASKLGLKTYWVNEKEQKSDPRQNPASASGPLEKILPWLDGVASEQPTAQLPNTEGILAVLRSTPAVIRSLTSACSKEQWRMHPLPDEWSLLEILAHLRDVEKEVNLPRFMLLTASVNPFIPGVDSDRWAVERKYNEQDDSTVLSDFCRNRSQLLAILESYSDEDWQQPVRHSFFGPTTRLELAKFIASHDRTHIQQISQTISAMS